MSQITDTILMIRPFGFHLNTETAVNNHYQQEIQGLSAQEATSKAQSEFDNFVEILRMHGVDVLVFQDDAFPETPDSVFPNNWMSFHEDGRIAMYPMFAENRRKERREEIFDIVADDFGFEVDSVEDFTELEGDGLFLEGTGSMILDRENGIAYAALSGRTDLHALETFCDNFDFDPMVFHAYQTVGDQRLPIYHTNVMMSVGQGFAVICTSCIDNQQERNKVVDSLKSAGKKVIDISENQVNQFAGNVLNVKNKKGQSLIVMSDAAYKAFRPDQISALEKHGQIVHAPLPVIETLGGGSARCMMAEVFLPKRVNVK